MHEPNPDDMLERLSSRHLTEWGILFQIHAEEAEGGESAPDYEVGPHGEIIEHDDDLDDEDDGVGDD